jgi:hypothetical protein
MRLHLATSGWIAEAPAGVRLRFFADAAAGAPPDEIQVERTVLPVKRPSWVLDDDPPSWLGAPAGWWSPSQTIRVHGDPPVEWDLGGVVQGASFVYEGTRALVRAMLAGVAVWERVIEPSEAVRIAAPCDHVSIRATRATLRVARLLDPATRAGDLPWRPVATVLVRAGLSSPWTQVAARAGGLLALDDGQWRALAGAVANRYDTAIPFRAPLDAFEGEIALAAAWRIAAACGFGWRDGPGPHADVDDADPAAILLKPSPGPLAYRIVDPRGRWAPSTPVAVPPGVLRELRVPPPPSLAARVRLGEGDSLLARRTIEWRIGDPWADRGAFEQRIGDGAAAPDWEAHARNGARPDETLSQSSTVAWPTPTMPASARQRAGDPWGRWSAWSAWSPPAVPAVDHHPLPPPLLAVFAEPAALVVRLGSVQGVTGAVDVAPPARWRPDALTLALHGRLQVLRRSAVAETIPIVLGPPVEAETDAWRYGVDPPIDPVRFAGGTVATRDARCDVMRAEPHAVVVRAAGDGASRRTLPAPGPALLAAPRGREDLWTPAGDLPLPVDEEFKLVGASAAAGAIYALRVRFDGGAGPIGNQVVAAGDLPRAPQPPVFKASFRAFDADRRAVLVIDFATSPDAGPLRIGWTWHDEIDRVPRLDEERLTALDGERRFLARLMTPDRHDVMAALIVWIAAEGEDGRLGAMVSGTIDL